jgi:hypothetical protein
MVTLNFVGFFQKKSVIWLFVTLKCPKGSTSPHHILRTFGKPSMSTARGGFVTFRPMVQEMMNIEQFCN